jgi:hypothetical protein
VPLPTEDKDEYFGKVEAEIARGFYHPNFAFPKETLFLPRDKKTPLAFSMDRFPGKPLEELFFKAERDALRLNWGQDEWLVVARELVKLFSFSEHHGFCQNDTHPGQYLVSWSDDGKPKRVTRVDALAASFWHKNKFFSCDKARWEYVPPECQRLSRRPEGLKGFEMPREADRFGLACLLFECLTAGNHVDYVGGDPNPARRVEKKEFAVLSMPGGAKVPDEVEAAYYGLPVEVTTLFERAFLGDPLKRPGPDEWLRVLRPAPPARRWFLSSLRLHAPLKRLARAAKLAMREYALAGIGAASLVLALWLLPVSAPPPSREAPAPVPEAQTHAAHVLTEPPAPDDELPTIPAPKRRAKNKDADQLLNRK